MNGPSKICGNQPNFTWSILEYFVLYAGPSSWTEKEEKKRNTLVLFTS